MNFSDNFLFQITEVNNWNWNWKIRTEITLFGCLNKVNIGRRLGLITDYTHYSVLACSRSCRQLYLSQHKVINEKWERTIAECKPQRRTGIVHSTSTAEGQSSRNELIVESDAMIKVVTRRAVITNSRRGLPFVAYIGSIAVSVHRAVAWRADTTRHRSSLPAKDSGTPWDGGYSHE